MKRPPAVLALCLFLVPVGCDSGATAPEEVSPANTVTKDQKIKIEDGLTKGDPVQIVAKTGAPPNQKMMLWALGSMAAAIDLTPPAPSPITQSSPGDWSPDGTQIAFMGFVPPTPSGAPSGYEPGWAIYVMDVDASGHAVFSTVTLVSQHFPSPTNPADDLAPAWSPDGTKIAWQCQQGQFPFQLPGGITILLPNTGICYSAQTSSGDWETPVFVTTDPPSGYGFYIDGPPSWSPESDQILFSRTARGCAQSPPAIPPENLCPFTSFDLWTVDVSTRVETNRTQTPSVDEQDPAWEPKPHSPKILYTTYSDGDEIDIFVGSLGLGGLTVLSQVTSLPGAETFPWWVPGGKQLTFTSGGPGRDVYIVDLAGGNLTNLTNSPTVMDDFARVRPPIITP